MSVDQVRCRGYFTANDRDKSVMQVTVLCLGLV